MLGVVWQLPLFKQLRQSGWLNQKLRLGFGGHWGAFASREEALGFLRPSRTASADDDDMATMNVEAFSKVQAFDWPVMFFMADFDGGAGPRAVTDLGGHLGVKYHAFRPLLRFPPDLSWQVVDVPAVCREGRRRLSPDTAALRYCEELEATAPCDVLLCSGVLQYLDYGLDAVIRRLPAKPRLILLNKVAVSDKPAFHTLESVGFRRIPYHVTTVADLDAIRAAHGYRLLARWDIPDRVFEVATATDRRVMTMIGEAWAAEG